MKGFVDLHIHTTYSDSTLTPSEVVDIAIQKGFSAISITDHDCVDGIEPALKSSEGCGLEVIPGVELTAEMDNLEIHILGYLIDYKKGWFMERLKQIREARVNRIYEMTKRLRDHGVNISAGTVFNISGPGAVGRLHLATALYNEGHVSSIGEAFKKYIGNGSPFYVKKLRFTPREAVKMIKDLGGVAVLAHPYTVGNDGIIPSLVDEGIRGIEVYHTDHPNNVMLHYEQMASRYGLLTTGGSDCHGEGKGGVLLGRIKVPYRVVDSLKSEAALLAKRRKGNE